MFIWCAESRFNAKTMYMKLVLSASNSKTKITWSEKNKMQTYIHKT